MASRADDTASFVSKKSTSQAVMYTSRLVLPSAMTWTEKSACVANLPHSHKTHARASCCLRLWCCCIAVGSGAAINTTTAAYSLVLFRPLRHLTRKNGRKKERHKKKAKELWEGSPTPNFLVGNYGLRRAERWDDMPSMSSEVGEI